MNNSEKNNYGLCQSVIRNGMSSVLRILITGGVGFVKYYHNGLAFNNLLSR